MDVFDTEINLIDKFNQVREICVNSVETLFFGDYIEQVVKN